MKIEPRLSFGTAFKASLGWNLAKLTVALLGYLLIFLIVVFETMQNNPQ